MIEAIEPTRSRLYTIEGLGGQSRVRAYDFEGNLAEELPAPQVSAAAATSAWPSRSASPAEATVDPKFSTPASVGRMRDQPFASRVELPG